ncbi:hypothetical protein OG21DRAFT_421776 [Imleria badia]|nr:hypothetical protein OG21DRAFT_421776 [Imleria badia]
MPKRPKSGPPYTDIPAEVYVVVTNPWGMSSDPHLRGKGGGRIPTIECIYAMGTRDEVILQFAEGTNIVPLLGEHHWANFAKHSPEPNRPPSTCVFLYNWRNNGDPANHNWTENFPTPVPLDTVPARSPYPAPSWTSPPPTLTNLVLRIPRPAIHPPIPNELNPVQEQQSVMSPPPSTVTPSPATPQQRGQPESGEQPAAHDLVSTSLFTTYEPPSQHPSHAQFLNRSQTRVGEPSSSQASPPSPKFIKKLDPYELDEDAFNMLRSPSPEPEDMKEAEGEDIKPTHHTPVKAEVPEVKTEEDDAQHNIASGSGSQYQPSQALLDAFNSLRRPSPSPPSAHPQTRDPRGLNDHLSVKAEFPQLKIEDDNSQHNLASAFGSRYQPSPALIDAFDSLHRPEQSPPSAHPSTREPRGLNAVPPASSGHQPSAIREANMNGLLRGTTAGASSLPSGSGARLIPGARVNIKRQNEDDVVTSPVGGRKKVKIEQD